jgi:hypothetical protein
MCALQNQYVLHPGKGYMIDGEFPNARRHTNFSIDFVEQILSNSIKCMNHLGVTRNEFDFLFDLFENKSIEFNLRSGKAG